MLPTIINRREARRRAGAISRATEYRLIKTDPSWPRPVQIATVLSGYIEAEITAWIEARAAERTGMSSSRDDGDEARRADA